jgi:hypothetical protein
MKPGVFWALVLALSALNFGIDLIIVGVQHLSGWEFLIMTGSWLALAGVGILVWLASHRNGRNGNGRV